MDIKKLETREAHDGGSELRVRGPNNKLTDFYITVVGVDSSLWRKIKMEIERDALLEKDVNAAEALARSTLSWRGLKDDGKEVELSVETAKSLYENAPYIQDQVDRHISDRANFLKPTTKR